MAPDRAAGHRLGDLAALARQRGARAELLGRLLVAEPGPAEAELAAAVPSLAAAFDDLAGLRSDYERLLLREVSCYESVFCRTDARLGAPDPGLLAVYERHDFAWAGRWRVAAGDHLGVQLLFYAHLCRAEAGAWDDDRPDVATGAVDAQRDLLAAHLGSWGGVAAEALRRAAQGSAYGLLAGFLDEFLAREADTLRPAADHPGMPPVAPDGALGDAGGPARVARRLLAPRSAGGYLLGADIGALAAAVGAPWRPSDTRARLRHVVSHALDHGQAGALAAILGPVARAWAATWSGAEARQPGAARTFRRWRLRAEATVLWLERLADRPAQPPPVLHVRSPERAAQALADLSAGGCVVATHPAPADVLAVVDALVRVEPDGREGWRGEPPLSLPRWPA